MSFGSDENKNKRANIIPFAAGRKASKPAKRAGANSGNGSQAAYQKALQAQLKQGSSSVGIAQTRWFHYLQVIVLLALVAWMMRSCQI